MSEGRVVRRMKTGEPKAASAHTLRLVGVSGAGTLMAGEMSRLVRRAHDDVWVPRPDKSEPGAVVYPFDERMACVAGLYHRTSARVLWQVLSSRAKRLEPLYAELRAQMEQQTEAWYWPGASISVTAPAVREFAAGERQVVGTVKNALIDGAGARGVALRVDPERPDVSIDVRLVNEQIFVSVDLAGRPMHQRGYRQSAGVAPLREDLAALMLMALRFDGRHECLVDPMAGSATIGIEAAAMASGRPIWCSGRSPAGMKLPGLRDYWPSKSAPLFADTQAAVLVNELDSELVAIGRRNAKTAGVEPQLEVRAGDFRSLEREQVFDFCERSGRSSERGLILCNPPYGARLGVLDESSASSSGRVSDPRALRRLYAELGRWCRQFRGWRAGFLVANPDFESSFGLQPVSKRPMRNGPLRAVLYAYEL